MPRLLRILIALLVAVFHSLALAQANPVSIEIDVAAKLHDRLQIPRDFVDYGPCYERSGGGMQARIPRCRFRYEFQDLKVVAWKNVTAGDIVPDPLPTRVSSQPLQFPNCHDVPLDFTYTDEIRYSKTATLRATTTLTNVTTQKHQFSLNGNQASLLGFSNVTGNLSRDLEKVTTLETNSSSETITLEERTTTIPLPVSVAPWTVVEYDRTTTHRATRLPISGSVIVDGKLVLQGYAVPTNQRALAGTKLQRVLTLDDESQRTFDVAGEIAVVGAMESLSIRPRLVKTGLTPSDPACREPKDARVNVAAKTTGQRTAAVRDCKPRIRIASKWQQGTTASVLFDIRHSESCTIYAGVVAFKTVSRGANPAVRMRDDYQEWREARPNFTIQWTGNGHLDDGEKLVDVKDVRVEKCSCVQ